MNEVKHRCGQCEYYLNQRNKCPHQENIATHKGCEIFKYTNPEGRIDGLISIIKSLEQENAKLKELLKEAMPKLYNTYRSDDLGPRSLPCRIEQALKGESDG